jgi:hypothetical protein
MFLVITIIYTTEATQNSLPGAAKAGMKSYNSILAVAGWDRQMHVTSSFSLVEQFVTIVLRSTTESSYEDYPWKSLPIPLLRNCSMTTSRCQEYEDILENSS